MGSTKLVIGADKFINELPEKINTCSDQLEMCSFPGGKDKDYLYQDLLEKISRNFNFRRSNKFIGQFVRK